MKIAFAPLESITTYHYRKIFDSCFASVDEYYIPFLSPMSSFSITKKENEEINVSNNLVSKKVIPQIISKNSKDTLWLIEHLKNLGYQEVNLNFGCPSGTVVSKGKGSGMLKDLSKMKDYLDEVFSLSPLPISIKSRIGVESENEFDKILEIYNLFPIKELIIHPRNAKELYHGPLHLDIFNDLQLRTSIPIVYNGDIKTIDDINYINESFPFIKKVMIGRGLIEFPDMLSHYENEDIQKNTLIKYINSLEDEYLSFLSWGNASFPIKEQWSYLIEHFNVDQSLKKKLFKERDKEKFFMLQEEIFSSPFIVKNTDGIKNKYSL